MELVDRGLAAERLALQLLRQEAHAVQTHRLDLRLGLGDAPPDPGIFAHRAAARIVRARQILDLSILRIRP